MGYHHGDLKRALLDAALDLLSESSVEKLSLRKVAQKAGVSHAAPYHHFNDKAAILRALAVRAYSLLDASMSKEQSASDNSPRGRLLAGGLGYIRFALSEPALFNLMWNRELVPMNDDELIRVADAAFSRLVDSVVRVFHNEKKNESDPMLLSIYLWSSVHGFAMLGLNKAFGPNFKADELYLMCERMIHSSIDAAHIACD